MKKIKVCCYARFSSNNQRVESIQTQLEAIRKYCDSNNMEIVAKFVDEAKSATTDSREGFMQMIEESKFKKWEAIVLYSLDRFSRNAANHYYYKSILDSYGIRLIAIVDGLNGAESAEESLMTNIKVGLAQYYSQHLSKLVLDSCIMTSKNALKAGGIDNLGFDTISQKYVINEEEAQIVRMIFELFNEGYSYKNIVEELNSNGFKTKLGNEFTVPAVVYILNNRKYNGYMIYNIYKRKERLTDNVNHRVMKSPEEHIVIPDVLPKLIDDDTFYKAQELLRRRKIYKIRDEGSTKYLLSSLVFCGNCGGKFYFSSKKVGKYKQERNIYMCKNRRNGCKVKDINANYLNGYIIMLLDEMFNESSKVKLIEMIDKSVKEAVNQDNIRLQVLMDDEKQEKIEIDRYSELANESTGLAKDALVSEIKKRVENTLTRQLAIKELQNFIKSIDGNIVVDTDEMTKRYQDTKGNDFFKMKEFVFNIIDRITIDDNFVNVDLDLSWFVKGYKKKIIHRLSIDRYRVARNKYQDYKLFD